MTDHQCPVLDLVIRKSETLQQAARIARTNAEALKQIADEAWLAAFEAEDAALDAESDVAEWDEVVDGVVTLEEFIEMKKPAENDQPFSFD
jgi:hypothetical protein